MRQFVLSAACAAVSAFHVGAQTVEFRIVERTGQTQADALDPVLDLAIQARVTGGKLGLFDLEMRIAGEAESRGTLARGLISNTDGTYATTFATNAAVGRGGLARHYSFDAGINASFNGLINSSAATFTNGPDQEIGLIAGAAIGTALLGTPGLDTDDDGNPDAWSGNGTGAVPANGTLVPVAPAMASTYFGGGEFVDIYRFRYTVADLAARTLHFQIDRPNAITFQQLIYNNGLWGAAGVSLSVPNPSVSALDIAVVPAPASGAVIAVAGIGCRRRRRPRV